jgi:uncharacterized membrane protein YbhN (UPF0104 family)
MRALTGASLALALLQSICTAVFAISGIRVAIGLTALAAVSGIYAPAKVANLAILAWIGHLRAQPSARWRKREVSKRERRSEQLQIVLSIVTLILVGLETWTHTLIHRKGPPPPAIHSSSVNRP